jgi:carnitine O-octanoyltransferase
MQKASPTFSQENFLPSLPLPPLKSTLNKYLESTRPFVTEIEYLNTKKILSNFENGIGKKLDFILRDKARKERNWVCLLLLFFLFKLCSIF